MSRWRAIAEPIARATAAIAFGLGVTAALLVFVVRLNRLPDDPLPADRVAETAIELEPPPLDPDPAPATPVPQPPTALLPPPPPEAPRPPPALAASALSELPAPALPTPGALGLLPALESGLPGSNGNAPSSAGEPDPAWTRARPLRRPTPRYPADAQRRGVQGFVTVRLRVDNRGNVAEVVVVASQPPGVFDDAARDAAMRYRFEPARRDGQVVESVVEQRIVFSPTP